MSDPLVYYDVFSGLVGSCGRYRLDWKASTKFMVCHGCCG